MLQLDWVQLLEVEPPRAIQPVNSQTGQKTQLWRKLEDLSRKKIDLSIHANQRLWMRIEPCGNPKRWRVKLHRAFLEAPPPVVHALARLLLSNDRKSHQSIQRFINTQSQRPEFRNGPRSGARQALRTAGRHFNLKQQLDAVCSEYFPQLSPPAISWGRRTKIGQSIQLGTYCRQEALIRIHPLLDSLEIPEYYLRFIIYHELLHHILPEQKSPSGRIMHHNREFRRLESRYNYFAQAQNFERNLFKVLAQSQRSWKLVMS